MSGAGYGKDFQRMEHGCFQKIGIVRLEDLIDCGGDAAPERIREDIFGDPCPDDEREHCRFRELSRTVEFPVVIGEIISFVDAVVGDRTMEIIFQRIDIAVDRAQAVFRPDQLVFLVFELFVFPEESFR